MDYRHLGNSGMLVSEISYGNWITHGSQVEEDAALACVRAALDEGITTFDTADVYAGTRAEAVLGRALKGERRGRPGDLHEGLLADRPRPQRPRPVPQAHHGVDRRLAHAVCRPTTSTSTSATATTTRRRWTRRCRRSPTSCTSGKAHYIGVSEWKASEIRAAHELARPKISAARSSQPQYSMLWRVIEAEVVPTCEELGIGQIVWSPMAQGVLTEIPAPARRRPRVPAATEAGSGFNWCPPS